MLVTTPDPDDRLAPGHSFKYAAALQEKAAPGNPVLIRIETMPGHGASTTSKRRSITAGIYSFVLHELGVVPKMPAPSRKSLSACSPKPC